MLHGKMLAAACIGASLVSLIRSKRRLCPALPWFAMAIS